MLPETTSYALKVEVPLDYATTLQRVREALTAEGFGVLTEIDMRATLKAKLDVDLSPYVVLGACLPPVAHSALTKERDIGVLLPCNVIVYAGERPEHSVVAAIDPVVQLGVTGNPDIAPLAVQVRDKLWRVLNALG